MSKKPAVLSANLVAVKGAGAPSPDMLGRGAVPLNPSLPTQPTDPQTVLRETMERGEASGAPLNFRVPESFRREFKVYAAQHGLKLNELLKLSFEAYQRTNSS